MTRSQVPSRIVVGVSGSAASVAALRWAAARVRAAEPGYPVSLLR